MVEGDGSRYRQARNVAPRFAATRCQDTYWVCETHDDRPWSGDKACGCGGGGSRRGRSPRAWSIHKEVLLFERIDEILPA